MNYKVAMLVPEGIQPRSPALWKEYAGIDVEIIHEQWKVYTGIYDAYIIGAPYKTEAVVWCDYRPYKLDAVNFIVNRGGYLDGYNTDPYGFGKAIEENHRFLPYDLRILVLGAGATGRAILSWLSTRHQMDKVYIWNRTEARALKAAVDFNCNACPYRINFPASWYDLIIDACGHVEDYDESVVKGAFSKIMAKHQALKAMSILFNDDSYLEK